MAKIDPNDPKATGALGGKARAAAMTAKQRSEAASKAGTARWAHPRATHVGELKIGELVIECAVLDEGKRVINDSAFQKALGRAGAGGQTYARRAAESAFDQLPIYVALKNLKPFIPNDFSVSTFQYIRPRGGVAVGVDATVIPAVCSIWLAARRAGVLRSQQLPTAERAEIIMNALATVGIIALIDEATGFQYDREREALQVILEQFVGKKLAAWVKTFPDDYYRQLAKLRGVEIGDDSQRPQYFGHLTNDIVYSRLAPGVRKELCAKNPRVPELGRRRTHHHRWLTRDVGHPDLKAHLTLATALMKLAPTYERFIEQLDHVAPRFGDTLPLLSYEQMQPPDAVAP